MSEPERPLVFVSTEDIACPACGKFTAAKFARLDPIRGNSGDAFTCCAHCVYRFRVNVIITKTYVSPIRSRPGDG